MLAFDATVQNTDTFYVTITVTVGQNRAIDIKRPFKVLKCTNLPGPLGLTTGVNGTRPCHHFMWTFPHSSSISEKPGLIIYLALSVDF